MSYIEPCEFVHDLPHPNKAFIARTRRPLIERDPVVFWQAVSCILVSIIIIQLLV